MKHILITTIAAVVLVGCGESQQSVPQAEAKPVEPVAETAKPEPPTAKAPDISIFNAVKEGNIEAVKQHLAAGTDVNAKDAGWGDLTPLHYAAQKGHKEIIELLIANGVNVNAKMTNGSTPLDLAIEYNQTETADLLREHVDWNRRPKAIANTADSDTAATFLSPAVERRREMARKAAADSGRRARGEPVKQTSRSTSNKMGEWVKKSMQEQLNRTYSGQLIIPPRVLEVSVVRGGLFSNTHKGIAKVQHKGIVHNVVVTIAADGESAVWEARRGSFLFLAQ